MKSSGGNRNQGTIFNLNNIIRQKREKEVRESEFEVYKKFVQKWLDEIYENDDSHACCTTDRGTEIKHLQAFDSEDLGKCPLHKNGHCQEAANLPMLIECSKKQYLKVRRRGDNYPHFVFMEFEDYKALRLVFNRDNTMWDVQCPYKIAPLLRKIAIERREYVLLPELAKVLAELEKRSESPKEISEK